MKFHRIWFPLLVVLVSCTGPDNALVGRKTSRIVSFELRDAYRAWQGVAVDSRYVYILTDRDESFGLENIISVYSHGREKVREVRQAYAGTDSKGNFMSFGDGNVIDGKLYATVYNFNSGTKPLESRVVVYSLPDLKLVGQYDIGAGVAESVTKARGSYWVTYHDEMAVRRFDLRFQPLKSYPLSQPRGEYGGYQGAYWAGDDFLVQMHGPNKPGLNPAKGLDRYRFENDGFVFIGTEEPLSYGSGQGVAVLDGVVLQNDRPGNAIVVGEVSQIAEQEQGLSHMGNGG